MAASSSVVFSITARDNATSTFKRVGSSLATIAGGFALGGAVSGGLSKAFDFAKNAAIGFNSELQQSSIAFTTMLGSGQKSKAFLDDLQSFAKTTPFEFGNLVSNAQNMMGMGIAAKDVIPDLRALGDSVASIGGSAQQVDSVTLAFDQMNAKGTLDMGNMNQLMQNGVPSALKILASSYGVTTGQMIKMISTGKIQSSEALPKLIAGIEKGTKSTAALGGMMDKQSQTFSGAMSNISDSLTQALAGAFKPFFGAVSTGAQKIATWLGSPAFVAFGAKVSAGIGKALSAAKNFVAGFDWSKVVKIIKTVWSVITQDLVPAISGLVSTYGPGIVTVIKDAFSWAGKLLGALQPLGAVVKDVFGFISDHKTTFQAIAVGVLAIVGAFKAWTIAQQIWTAVTKTATAVQLLFDAAMDANPIGLVILAIMGVAAAFAYLWTHSAAFRAFWIGIWHGIKAAAFAVWNWLKSNWPYLLGILTGPIGLAAAWIYKHWDSVVGFVKKLPGRIASVAKGMWDGIKDAFRGAINWIIRGWDALHFSIPSVSFLGMTIGGFDLGLPHIPELASGGIVRARPGGTLALLGEAGRDEAVVPLARGGAGGIGSQRMTVELVAAPGDQVAEVLMSLLRPRVRGFYSGNVQVALGGHG